MKMSTARRIAGSIALLVAVLQLATPAVALNGSATAGTTRLATGTWLVTPVLTATSANSQAALSINSLSTKKNSYFWIRNFGSFDLQHFTVGQTVSPTGRSSTVEIRRCDGTWDTAKDTCSGTISTLLTTNDGQSGSVVVPIPIPVGAAVQLAAYPTKNGMATAISAYADRSAVRAARTSNA